MGQQQRVQLWGEVFAQHQYVGKHTQVEGFNVMFTALSTVDGAYRQFKGINNLARNKIVFKPKKKFLSSL